MALFVNTAKVIGVTKITKSKNDIRSRSNRERSKNALNGFLWLVFQVNKQQYEKIPSHLKRSPSTLVKLKSN